MNKIEQKFYKTFEIEPLFKYCDCCNHRFNKEECEKCDKEDICEYLAIDYLKLILILSKCYKELMIGCYSLASTDLNGIKEEILKDCIDNKEYIKDDIDVLFNKWRCEK